mmetsp:Transcript_12246/g.26422  ORF Transcript_12246/g.26422 Transcript_12246/m.26422 type:complete len:216 (+) Transcript_12246:1608-2255(+)
MTMGSGETSWMVVCIYGMGVVNVAVVVIVVVVDVFLLLPPPLLPGVPLGKRIEYPRPFRPKEEVVGAQRPLGLALDLRLLGLLLPRLAARDSVGSGASHEGHVPVLDPGGGGVGRGLGHRHAVGVAEGEERIGVGRHGRLSRRGHRGGAVTGDGRGIGIRRDVDGVAEARREGPESFHPQGKSGEGIGGGAGSGHAHHSRKLGLSHGGKSAHPSQ